MVRLHEKLIILSRSSLSAWHSSMAIFNYQRRRNIHVLDIYYSRHVSFGPRIFERSRDCPEKQPNSPHIDFTKGKRKREKERRECGNEKYELTYGWYQKWASANRRMELFGGQLDKGRVPKVYSWVGSHRIYRYKIRPRIVWREWPRPISFFFRSLLLTYISLESSSPVSSLCPSSSGLFQRIFDILLLTDALLYGTALLAFVDYLFHSRKQAKGTGSRDAQWTITISTVNRWQKDDRYASSIIYRN